MNIQKVKFEVLKTLGVIDNIYIKELIPIVSGDQLNSPVYAYKCDIKFSFTNSNFDLISNFKFIDNWNNHSNKSINNIVILFDESTIEEFASYVENFKVITLDCYIYKLKEEFVELSLDIYKVFNNINDISFLNNRCMLVGKSLNQVVIINNKHSYTITDLFNDKFKFLQDVTIFYNWLELEFLRSLLTGEIKDINSFIDTTRYSPTLYVNSESFSSVSKAYKHMFNIFINEKVKELFIKYLSTSSNY